MAATQFAPKGARGDPFSLVEPGNLEARTDPKASKKRSPRGVSRRRQMEAYEA
jgi:hypothetical protein